MQKAIILERPAGARLANQLLNFISIYAYCLEKGYKCENFCFFEEKKQKKEKIYYSFFNYNDYFNFPATNFLNRFIVDCYIKNKLCYKLKFYPKYSKIIKKIFPKQIIFSGEEKPVYHPPTENNDFLEKLCGAKKDIYFSGWLFRNPKGIEKYYSQIIDYFKPKKKISENVKKIIAELRKKYSHIAGVHIRQGDYKELFCSGKYYFSEKEVRKILNEYLVFANKEPKNTIFLICSDDNVNEAALYGLNYIICKGKAIEDLFTLAACDVIIGSNSTFGAFASYYGDIPFIVFEKDKMDWDYYKNLDFNSHFFNKKCTLAKY